jgi:isoamylase
VTPPATHRDEFRDMVKALHRAGIGVILDVVFNHTAEGGADGPMISFKGLGNETFYHLDFADRSRYRDYTGCGNTVNATTRSCPLPHRLPGLLGARHARRRLPLRPGQRHGPRRGRRADAAPAGALGHRAVDRSSAGTHHRRGLGRRRALPGRRLPRLSLDGVERALPRRARASCAATPGLVDDEVATRIAGSSDLYQARAGCPSTASTSSPATTASRSTTWSATTTSTTRANGEDNRDGHDHNLSWNCGVEGATDDPEILALRRRQARNFMAILLLSQGVPMLHSGDEVLRTKAATTTPTARTTRWLDRLALPERNADMLRFTRGMIALRKRHPSLRRERFLTGEPDRGAAAAGHPMARHRARRPAGTTPRPACSPSRWPG